MFTSRVLSDCRLMGWTQAGVSADSFSVVDRLALIGRICLMFNPFAKPEPSLNIRDTTGEKRGDWRNQI